MADDQEADGTAAPETAAPRRSKKLLLILAVLLLIIGGGVWYYFHHNHAKKAHDNKPSDATSLISIPTIISNLDVGSTRPVFVRITAKLQVSNTTPEEMAEKMPQIQDLFQSYLHESRQSELSGNGIYRLREALLGRIATELAPIKVQDLFFTEFLIQ